MDIEAELLIIAHQSAQSDAAYLQALREARISLPRLVTWALNQNNKYKKVVAIVEEACDG